MVRNLVFRSIREDGLAGNGEMHFRPKIIMRTVLNVYCREESRVSIVFFRADVIQKPAFPSHQEIAKLFASLDLSALIQGKEKRAVTHHHVHNSGLLALEMTYRFSFSNGKNKNKIVQAIVRKDLCRFQQRLSWAFKTLARR